MEILYRICMEILYQLPFQITCLQTLASINELILIVYLLLVLCDLSIQSKISFYHFFLPF